MSKEQTDWVMVPREPTPEMCAAVYEPGVDGPGSMWRAILTAAPSPPEAQAAVAWQVMLPGGHEGSIFRIEEDAQAVAGGFKTAFVRALYPSPSPAGGVQAVTEEMVERAKSWFDDNFNGLPDTDALVRGVLTAALSSQAQTTGGVE